jgi:hypothetical protein
MKLLIVGAWAVIVTLGAGFAVAQWRVSAPADDPASTPRFEGLRYTSLPTLSVPVIEGGRVSGYVVVRLVYTADAATLRDLASEPDAFITDEMFRTLYGRAETVFGRLVRLDLDTLAEEVRSRVNERMGDEVVQDLLVDGLNYIDLTSPEAQAAARATAAPVLIPESAGGTTAPASRMAAEAVPTQ